MGPDQASDKIYVKGTLDKTPNDYPVIETLDKRPQEIQPIEKTDTIISSPMEDQIKDSVRKRFVVRNETNPQDSLIAAVREMDNAKGRPKATALTKGRKGRPPSPKPQDVYSTDEDDDDEVMGSVNGRFGHTILQVRKGIVLEKSKKWEEKQMSKEIFSNKKSWPRPNYLPGLPKKNTLQYNSGHMIESPSVSIPSTMSIPSTPSTILTPPPECPNEKQLILQAIKGRVSQQRKRYDILGSIGSSCETLDESENEICSQDEAEVFGGVYTSGKVKDRKRMWETKIKEFQKESEKPTSR